MNKRGYKCICCGEWHSGLPMAYAADRPASWYDVPEDKLESDVFLSSDHCVIADRFFFLRGNIEIPIIGFPGECFSWGVWVSLSEENFERVNKLWTTPGRENVSEPMFGWLDTSLPLYPETLLLKTNVHTKPVGFRPSIELEPTDHPLALEQREGITLARVEEIAARLLHS